MNWFYNTVALLKEYGRFNWAAWNLIALLVASVYGAFAQETIAICGAFILLTVLIWEISDVYLFHERDSYKQQLADKEDENVLLHGGIAKLKEEVESLKASAEARKNHIPKKRPPFKKKTKTAPQENENKN